MSLAREEGIKNRVLFYVYEISQFAAYRAHKGHCRQKSAFVMVDDERP
jgi:hypothetical protein